MPLFSLDKWKMSLYCLQVLNNNTLPVVCWVFKPNIDIDASKACKMCLLAYICTFHTLYSLQWGRGCKIKYCNLSLPLTLQHNCMELFFFFFFSSWVVCRLCHSFNPLTDSNSALCLRCGWLRRRARPKGQRYRRRVVWKCERSLSATTDGLAAKQGYFVCQSYKWNIVMNRKSYNLCCFYALSS